MHTNAHARIRMHTRARARTRMHVGVHAHMNAMKHIVSTNLASVAHMHHENATNDIYRKQHKHTRR
jgi:hypothetical protein